MQSNNLNQEIIQLSRRKVEQENQLVDNIKSVKKLFDPIFLVKKILPSPMPAAPVFINNLMDKSIYGIANKFIKQTGISNSSSFIERKTKNALEQIIIKVVTNNRYKIKAIGIAVLKNLIRK